jgi:hypothetical protein
VATKTYAILDPNKIRAGLLRSEPLSDLDRDPRTSQAQNTDNDRDCANDHHRLLVARRLRLLLCNAVDTLRRELHVAFTLFLDKFDLGPRVVGAEADRPSGNAGELDEGGVLTLAPLLDLRHRLAIWSNEE